MVLSKLWKGGWDNEYFCQNKITVHQSELLRTANLGPFLSENGEGLLGFLGNEASLTLF